MVKVVLILFVLGVDFLFGSCACCSIQYLFYCVIVNFDELEARGIYYTFRSSSPLLTCISEDLELGSEVEWIPLTAASTDAETPSKIQAKVFLPSLFFSPFPFSISLFHFFPQTLGSNFFTSSPP